MEYYLNDEQRGLQEMVRNFAKNELIPIAADIDRTGEFPMEVYKKAAERG